MKPFKQNLTAAVDRRQCLLGLSAVLWAGTASGAVAGLIAVPPQTSAVGGVLSFPAPSDVSLYMPYFVSHAAS